MLENEYVTYVLHWQVGLLTTTRAFREGTKKSTGHALQLEAPEAENVPATQGAQAPPDTENVPAGQGVHNALVVPVHNELAYWPAPQTVQDGHPVSLVAVHAEDMNFPAPHSVQITHTVWLVPVHADFM